MDVYNYNCSLQSVLPLLNDNMHDAVLCSKILITLHTCLHDISTYSNNPAAWEYVAPTEISTNCTRRTLKGVSIVFNIDNGFY